MLANLKASGTPFAAPAAHGPMLLLASLLNVAYASLGASQLAAQVATASLASPIMR